MAKLIFEYSVSHDHSETITMLIWCSSNISYYYHCWKSCAT